MIRVILGLPASGKTEFVKRLKQNSMEKFIHTDDYINENRDNFEDSLYDLMRDLASIKNHNIVVEGVQGYRLLRKGLQEQSFFPDEVITCICDESIRRERYKRREGKELNKEFDARLIKFWNDYMDLLKRESTKPKFTIIKT
jgi:dephospho-CoA kinase